MPFMDRLAYSRFRTLFYPQPPSFSQKQRDFPQIVRFRIPHNSQTSGGMGRHAPTQSAFVQAPVARRSYPLSRDAR